jgi:PAS domain S-box-containing protein
MRQSADFAGRKVGVVKSNIAVKLLKKRRDIKLEIYESLDHAISDLLLGRIDALAYPEPAVSWTPSMTGLGKRIHEFGRPLVRVQRAIAVRKPGGEIIKRLNLALKEGIKSGNIDRIRRNWHAKTNQPEELSVFEIAAFSSIVLLLVGLIWWHIRFFRRLKQSFPASPNLTVGGPVRVVKRTMIMASVFAGFVIIVSSASIFVLYTTALKEARISLIISAKGMARLIETIGEDHYSMAGSRSVEAKDNATSRIKQALHRTFQNTELTLAQRDGNEIRFILRQRHARSFDTRPIPFDTDFAAPMRRALVGQSGAMIGNDYRGETVLAAYVAIESLSLGFVVKKDMNNFRAPYLRASIFIWMMALLLAAAGAAFLIRLNHPIIGSIVESESRFRAVFDQTLEFIGLLRPDGTLLETNQGSLDSAGVKATDVVGKFFWDTPWWRHSADQRDWLRNAVADAALGNTVRREVTHQAQDGSLQTLDFSIMPVRSGNGEIVFLVPEGRDMTDRRHAEELSTRLGRIVEQSLNEIYVFDTESLRLLLVNLGARKNLGHSNAELMKLTPYDLKPEFTRESFDELLQPLRDGIREQTIFFATHERKDGSTYPIEVCLQLMKSETPPVFVEFVQDITGQRGLQQAVVESDKKLRQALANAGHAIWEWDIANRKITADEQSIRMFGYDPEIKVFNFDWWNSCVHPDDREAIKIALDDVAEGRNNKFEVEYRFQSQSEEWLWISAVGAPTEFDANGRPKLISGTHRDVTERRNASTALRNNELRAHAVLNSVLHGIIVTDGEGVITSFNPAAENMFGVKRQDAIGRAVADLIIPERYREAHEAGLRNYRSTGKTNIIGTPIEIEALHADGTEFPVELAVQATELDDGLVFTAMIKDISERRNIEKMISEHNRNFQENLIQTVEVLAHTIEQRDPYTSGHQNRVMELAVSIAGEMRLPTDQITGIRLGSLIHDVGKISLPAEILSYPGRLSKEQMELVKTHPANGYDIVKDVAFEWPVAEMVLQHHERIDGSGYPRGLKGAEICLEARIIGVADVVEAICSHRPYRPGRGIEVALAEIIEHRGSFFDAAVVDACLSLFREKSFKWADGTREISGEPARP